MPVSFVRQFSAKYCQLTFLLGWELVDINAGEGVSGFVVENNHVVWNQSEFTGWLGKSPQGIQYSFATC